MSDFNDITNLQMMRSDPSFIQEAIVKDNRDPLRMGRLKVWIVGSESFEDNKAGWITCDYATPFGGRTQGEPFATKYEDYPKSYGFWGVPPDVNVRVFVFFVNGRMDKAYWFSCAYDYGMTNSVPGPHTKQPSIASINTPLPVTEYDRNSPHSDISGAYPNVNLIDGLRRQMMLYDDEMSVADRSAKRQVPYSVYGISSPRGNHIILDDGFKDGEDADISWDDADFEDTETGSNVNDTVLGDRKHEGILLRTRSGASIMISESKGNIFIINRDGSARVELDADGNVTILGNRDVSIRAKRDVNVLAERDYNVDVLGNYNLRVQGNFNQDLNTSSILNNGAVNWQCNSDISFKANTYSIKSSTLNLESNSVSIKSSGSLVLQGGAISLNSSSGIAMAGGGGSMSVSSSMNYSGSFHAAGDVTSSGVSLNNHTHPHGEPYVGTPVSGSGSSPSISAVQSASSANAVQVNTLPESGFNDVLEVLAEASVEACLSKDIGVVSDKSLSTLCYVMPVNGTIQNTGYWGPNVLQKDGSTDNNTGWSIDVNGTVDVCTIGAGIIQFSEPDLFIVDHLNGYASVYKGCTVKAESRFAPGNDIDINVVFGTVKDNFLFEMRKSTSSVYGYVGTVDPGLFFIEVTESGIDSRNKVLTQGQTTNPVCLVSSASSYTSSGLVKLTSINTIITTLPLSGSLNDPSGGASTSSNTTKSSGFIQGAILPEEQEPLKSDATPQNWVVTSSDSDLTTIVKNEEGTIAAQTARHIFRDGKFHMFKDPVKFYDIGYGHQVTSSEIARYTNGITPEEADKLLETDLIKFVNAAKRIAVDYNMKLPRDAQVVLVCLCYQCGPGTVRKFKKCLAALAKGKYVTAGAELKDSTLYRQTPARTQRSIAKLNALGGG